MKCILRYWAIADLTFGDLLGQSQFYNSDFFMKTTVAPSNLYITVLIGVGAYSNAFKRVAYIGHGICHCKYHGFPTVY